MRVLLVEDDALLRETVAEGLAAIGHVVTTTASAEDALAALADGADPRAVVTDVDLGAGLNGLEFAAHLRERAPGLAVIIMTGRDSYLLQRAAHPRERCLLKPVSLDRIATAIAELRHPARVPPRLQAALPAMPRERRRAPTKRPLHEVLTAAHALRLRATRACCEARMACQQATLVMQQSLALRQAMIARSGQRCARENWRVAVQAGQPSP